MPFKINVSEKSGKTYKFELESEDILGKELHEIFQGKELLPALEGYELEITGMSDKSGFTAMKEVAGVGLKKVLLTYGKGMHKRPRREGKKKISNKTPKGLRLRKTVRGKVLSPEIVQINLKVVKEGAKPLAEVFEGQATGKAKENRASKRKAAQAEKAKPEEEPQKPEEKVEAEAPKEEAKKAEESKSEEKPAETPQEAAPETSAAE